jgi:glycosyltransferase involved in cell wall biosynthesis
MNTSFCVHSYNEADALRRLILSSLPLADFFNEWVVIDHRSDDATPQVCEEMARKLADKRITLKYLHEPRDFSAAFTFADIRTATIKACSNKVVVLHDADFILGPRFAFLVQRGRQALLRRRSPYFGATYAVPCIWDRLVTSPSGVIETHGRIWIHKRRARVLMRDSTVFRQIGDGGRWEKVASTNPKRPNVYHLSKPKRQLLPHAVVSVNAKPADRIALRDTMTMFLQDAMQGVVEGEWIENYEAGQCRPQPPYKYSAVSLRNWRLYAPNLDLAT